MTFLLLLLEVLSVRFVFVERLSVTSESRLIVTTCIGDTVEIVVSSLFGIVEEVIEVAFMFSKTDVRISNVRLPTDITVHPIISCIYK
jgi:hypothetical protein